jgi:DnaJ-like protein
MKFSIRCAQLLTALTVLVIGASLFTTGVGAQDEGWRIIRADYGYRDQRTDVTNLLADLISRGGVNGRLAVNNQTMGGDPAVGKDKSLRIFARNRRNEEREFEYKEGGFFDVRMFAVRRDDWDDRPATYGGPDRDEPNGLRIIRAFYGVQRRTVDVTDLLRSRVREGALSFVVTNSALGGDPAIGADKILIVVYKFEGRETAAAVREGNTLTIP